MPVSAPAFTWAWTIVADRGGIGAIADQPERLGGPPLRRSGSGPSAPRSSAGRAGRVADETERERRHLPDLGILVHQRARQRLDRLRQADAPERERGAAPDARFTVVSRRTRSEGGGGATIAGAVGRRRREDDRTGGGLGSRRMR